MLAALMGLVASVPLHAETAVAAKSLDQVKSELLAVFEQKNKTEKREVFASLPPAQQTKVLTYYAAAKAENPDEKVSLKGTYNLISYYRNLQINESAVAYYQKKGSLPDGELPAVCGNASMVLQGYSKGSDFADLEKARKLDDLTIELTRKQIAEDRKQIAENDKKVAELQKNIDLLNTLLKALK